MNYLKVSILISSYNGETFITEQLDSIRKQTVIPHEVIIIDDHSTDDTVKVINEYIVKYGLNESWKVRVNTHNKGWKYNFHYGVQYTTGNAVMYCDQDDIWMPQKIEQVLQILESDHSINAVGTYETFLYNDGHVKPIHVLDKKLETIELGLHGENWFIRCSGCSMIVRKSFLEKIDRYYVDCWAHDDMVWKLASIDGSFRLLHDSSIFHRIHGNNESRKKKRSLDIRMQECRNNLCVCEKLKEFIGDYTEVRNRKNKFDLVQKIADGNKCRLMFLDIKSPLMLIRIIFSYRTIYRTKRQLLGDILLVYRLL